MKKGGKSKIQTSRIASHVEHNFCITTVAKKWLILTPNLVIFVAGDTKKHFFFAKRRKFTVSDETRP